MAATFDYAQAKNTMNKIEDLKSRLNSTLNEANDLIKRNVNNDNVWNSDTSAQFMTEWTKYADQSFPEYISSFETQIRHITTAIDTYASTEG